MVRIALLDFILVITALNPSCLKSSEAMLAHHLDNFLPIVLDFLLSHDPPSFLNSITFRLYFDLTFLR